MFTDQVEVWLAWIFDNVKRYAMRNYWNKLMMKRANGPFWSHLQQTVHASLDLEVISEPSR